MNSYNFENDFPIVNDINSSENYKYDLEKKNKLIKNNIIHKIFDYFNFSIIILIITLSFLSFDSQRKWTNYYSAIQLIRHINSNLMDYSSTAEAYYLTEIESLDEFRTTTTKDLIYLSKPSFGNETSFLANVLKQLHEGLKEGSYQMGY